MPDTHDTQENQKRQTRTARQSAAREPLHARPVNGKIDYAALIRDTMAKFPKILAALAK